VTSSLSVELATGYTDARYTTDFRFSNTALNPLPLVSRGDSIVGASSEAGGGQPTAPFTASGGVEYRFSAFAHESFLRLDAEYEAHARWVTPSQDAGSSQFDPANFTLPSTTYVSLRGGIQFGGWSLQPFADNLFNTHALTDYNYTICSNPGAPPAVACQPNAPGASRLERAFTFRPRTIGITAIFRQ
jgi:hypothetical protein